MNKYYFFVIFSVIIWSSMGLFLRFVSVSGLVAYFAAAMISAVIFLVVLLRKGRLKNFFTKKQVWLPVTIGIFGVVNNVSYFYAYQLTTIATAAFVHYLAPVLVLVLAPLLLSERTTKKSVYAIVIALIGTAILLNPTHLQLSDKNFLGILLAFVSAIGYAFGIILFKKASKHYDNIEILFSQMFFSVVILAPYILYVRPSVAVTDIVPLLTLGVVHQGVAVLLFISALRHLPAQNVSVITYLDPVGASALAALFLHEILSLGTVLGGALVVLSCYLTIGSVAKD